MTLTPAISPDSVGRRSRIAFYGGSFDPVHLGHLSIAESVVKLFGLDRFVFVPAFHAPHKKRAAPTSSYDRYAMLSLATAAMPNISVSKIEIEAPERPYTVETLTRLKSELPDADIFFVMGADSWLDITTWRDWERVLSLTNHIVVTRPGYEIRTDHVSDGIISRVVDLRGKLQKQLSATGEGVNGPMIYLTDMVAMDISATGIRQCVRSGEQRWKSDVPEQVANYIEKYQIYS